MRVLSTNPIYFFDGNLADCNLINSNLEYAKESCIEVSDKRYSHSIVTIPFNESVKTGYTSSLSSEAASYRYYAPNTVEVERSYLYYKGTGGTVNVNVYDVATGLVPTGHTNPMLTLTASSSTIKNDVQVIPFLIPAGATWRFQLASTTSFTATQAYMVLHLRSDRYQPGTFDNLITPELIQLSESDDFGAETFSNAVLPIAAAVTNNLAFTTAIKPSLFSHHNFTSSTSANLLRTDLPRAYSGSRQCQAIRLVGYAVMASTGSAGQTITVALQNASGSTVQSVAISVDGLTFASQDSGAFSVDLTTSSATVASTTASDYRITFVNSGATSCYKAYAYLYIA